jgi:hypothetical protein
MGIFKLAQNYTTRNPHAYTQNAVNLMFKLALERETPELELDS